jgi:TatD DNase family protein
LKNFRTILEAVSKIPRLVSIHSYRASGLILKELQQRPITIPVLHWWTGSAGETSEAVELGCYFSIHSAVARQSKFRTRVPRERLLLESDHGYNDPPAAIPCRIEWVEYLVAQQYKLEIKDLRNLVWRNLATIVHQTRTLNLLPESLAVIVAEQDIDKLVVHQKSFDRIKFAKSQEGVGNGEEIHCRLEQRRKGTIGCTDPKGSPRAVPE